MRKTQNPLTDVALLRLYVSMCIRHRSGKQCKDALAKRDEVQFRVSTRVVDRV
jgi:hypothetical protein